MITVVLTACNRPDLLAITLRSFFKFNTYPIERFIVIEDSGTLCNESLRSEFPVVEFIYNEQRLGQIKSIDKAYQLVTTPYIFHMEEDWEFYQERFIEDSLSVLESNANIFQVWIRALHDTNGHPTLPASSGYRLLKIGWKGIFHGFSFNPGLRRLSDYKAVGSYSAHAVFDRKNPGQSEIQLGQLYMKRGFRAAILKKGYVRHIGYNRHVN